jgi:hypothetical protein
MFSDNSGFGSGIPTESMLDASYAVLDEEAWYRLRPGAR